MFSLAFNFYSLLLDELLTDEEDSDDLDDELELELLEEDEFDE